MKKRIRVAVKRLICLVTICAMTVGACPFPVAATEEKGVNAETETEMQESTEVNTTVQEEENDEENKSEAQSDPVYEKEESTENSSTAESVAVESESSEETAGTEQESESDTDSATEPTTEDSMIEQIALLNLADPADTISYKPDLVKEVYCYDDIITYTVTSDDVAVEKIDYYVSDADGKPVTDNRIHITREGNRLIVKADNSDSSSYETKATHYITFSFSGDENYTEDTQTFALNYERKKNEIVYTAMSGDGIYEYGEAVTLVYGKGAEAGGISCYQLLSV